MKKLNKPNPVFLALCLALSQVLFAQEEKPELSVNLHYFNQNGSFQYLKVKTMVKEDNKLKAVNGAVLNLYLDEASAENFIGKVKTDEKGEAKTLVPPTLKDKWTHVTNHKFIAVSEKTKKFDETTTELAIAKAKIVLDTLNEEGARKVSAQVLAFDSVGWVPVKGVELKIGVRRLGGDLKIGEEETYTTDSTGSASGEFKLTGLPAIDRKNNVVLVAKTEDNEQYGNLTFEKTVPWGKYAKPESNFNRRTLWGTRDKAPWWLLMIAGSIMVGVWGVIVYLILQIRKIKKIAKKISPTSTPATQGKQLELQNT